MIFRLTIQWSHEWSDTAKAVILCVAGKHNKQKIMNRMDVLKTQDRLLLAGRTRTSS